MNAITRAVDVAMRIIPRRVLEEVFVERTAQWRQAPKSISECIMEQVIRPRVLVDCNLVGGTEAFIYLDDIPYERMNDYTSVYRIPKTKTQGRSILSALNITFADPTKVSSYGVAAGAQNTTLLQAGQAVMDAYGALPVTSTHRVQLIGENTIMVRDTIVLPPDVYLRCILANDENMSHLQLRSYQPFCKLVELAIKAYIYWDQVIEVDIGKIRGGQEIGKFKEIVDGYSEAEEQYQEFLANTWQKVAYMQDNETMTRFIRSLVGGYR
ncbi:hypothetical protein [Burkholderia phage FLC9]|nr:hypothetical protein [Burkholderia phage FLC9]